MPTISNSADGLASGGAAIIPVVIALGSNLGDRALTIRRAVRRLTRSVRVVRMSSLYETAPVAATHGSAAFLNAALLGYTRLAARDLLEELHRAENELGRARPAQRNAPRTIDLDLILYGGYRLRSAGLTVPHPRWREREFVLAPIRELRVPWLWWLENRSAIRSAA